MPRPPRIIFVASEYASVKSIIGRFIATFVAIKRLEKLKREKRPDIILHCPSIRSIKLKSHKLLGLEVLELKLADYTGREYSIGQVDTSKVFKETVLAIKNHLDNVCGVKE